MPLIEAYINKYIVIVKFLINSDLDYYAKNMNAIKIVKTNKLLEFYEKFKIEHETVQLPPKIQQTQNDILKYINSQDLESIKKCTEFDFSIDQYNYFFKALELNNYEITKAIFDFIKNKEDLQNSFEDISFIFNEEIKINYHKLFKNIEVEKIKDKLNELLSELNRLEL
jgi:hypothetical protein